MIEKFVRGRWYRVKTWDGLIKEFPLAANPDKVDVPGGYYYTTDMDNYLNDNSRIFQAQYTADLIPASAFGWNISPQMCEPIGKEILEEIMKEL